MGIHIIKKCILLLFAFISSTVSYTQTAFDFKGTIGKYPVVVSLYGYMSEVER